jgi:hypothetical protein
MQRESNAQANATLMSRRAAAACWIAAACIGGQVRPAFGKYGDSAKIAPGIQELTDAITNKQEAPKGPSIYDKESIMQQEERIAKVDKEWRKVVKEVDKAVGALNYKAAVSAIALRMGTIKPKMREISRIAADGDVIVRQEGKAAPKFDYNSGKFEFKAIAQLPEDVFLALGRFTAAAQKQDAQKAQDEWTAAKAIYDQWCAALKLEDELEADALTGQR